MDVRTLMRRSAGFHPDREAIVHEGARWTFGHAWERALQLANGLLALGLVPGDRVGVLEDNCLTSADALLGPAAGNFVRVPLYARNSRDAHGHMLAHTSCRVLLVTEKYAEVVAGLEEELPDLQRIIVRDAAYEDWITAQDAADPDPQVSPDDNYIIRHTAGTTGLPKGVVFSHRAWLAAARDWFFGWPPIEIGDRCLHVGPISHGSGYLFTPMWLSGGSNILVDHFDSEECLDLMERERIAYMFTVPAMLATLARHPSVHSRDFGALKVLNVGAAPITEETVRLGRDAFGDVLYQIYGQTETGAVTGIGPREWFSQVKGSQPLRSAGRPLPFVEVKIVDERHRPVPVGDPGEIAVRSDGQMKGFWGNPAATEARMVDGFVLTGDVGRQDANGYVYVLDRKDDMIISGGFNIWPAELENVIASHPGVLEVAVFGVPDARWGETPVAVCTVDGETSVTEHDIIELCRGRLGSYKKPSTVVLTTDPLPRTPVGKVSRRMLQEPFWAENEGRVAGN